MTNPTARSRFNERAGRAPPPKIKAKYTKRQNGSRDKVGQLRKLDLNEEGYSVFVNEAKQRAPGAAVVMLAFIDRLESMARRAPGL